MAAHCPASLPPLARATISYGARKYVKVFVSSLDDILARVTIAAEINLHLTLIFWSI